MGNVVAASAVGLSEPALIRGEPLHVLKHDDLFAVFNAWGDFRGLLHEVGPSTGADGLFQDDTRILSRLTLRLADHVPQLLGGTIGRDNVVFSAHLTNEAFEDDRGRRVAPSQLGLQRRRLLWHRRLYEALQVENFSPAPVTTHLTIEVGADFRDVFEIRGASRVRRGELMRPLVDGNSLILSYRGLDGELRRTAICFSVPVDIQGQKIRISDRSRSGRDALFADDDLKPR